MAFGRKERPGLAPLEITLIESPDIPTVGVGEATVPGMVRTLKNAGISEKEFFKRCNASFKLGVSFDGWNVNRNGKPISYINPFSKAPNEIGSSNRSDCKNAWLLLTLVVIYIADTAQKRGDL